MDYCKTSTDKSIAGVIAAVLAFKGSGWALLVGFAMNILLSNMEFQKKKLEISETEPTSKAHPEPLNASTAAITPAILLSVLVIQ